MRPYSAHMGVVDDFIHSVRVTVDVQERARLASELVATLQSGVKRLSRIRREALEQMLAGGMTQAEIAKSVDLSEPRVSQILSAGSQPTQERLVRQPKFVM